MMINNTAQRLAYAPQEVADFTGLSLQSVYNYISSGQLKAIQPGGKGSLLLVPADALSQFLGTGDER